MKYALVENIRTEATKGTKGICPNCGSELIAKCGDLRIDHWAHKGKRKCDTWWENETEWHRSWKNNFPDDWQEVSLRDNQTNEKHIADVRTEHGLVIEFQHSFINSEERISREAFYQNIVWIVDGARLQRDYPRFGKAQKNIRNTNIPKIFTIEFADECFPKAWLGSSVPVIFDFKGVRKGNDKDLRKNLYCLFPALRGEYRVLDRRFAEISRKAFIKSTINGEWTLRVRRLMDTLNQAKQERLNQIAKAESKRANIALNKITKMLRGPKRRRRL